MSSVITSRGDFWLKRISGTPWLSPVCYDATHSVQEPGGLGGASGGRRDYAGPLALAAAAVGIDALFIETHPSPDDALSDAGCQIALSDMPELLTKLLSVHNAIS
jgi:2-dehydro-3-deoxyphosphooctonate aldolase (KDO 8-P synthase)